jgi:hypothetical protein
VAAVQLHERGDLVRTALSRPQLDLVDALDRTLGSGVVVAGDLTLSLADVDLVHVSLRALLASVATLEQDGRLFPPSREPGRTSRPGAGPPRPPGNVTSFAPSERATATHARSPEVVDRGERVEHGLIRLVLTVVELLRKLLERQSLRRVEAGSLDEDQIERLGRALDQLQRQMEELKHRFDLTDDDLELRLGPLVFDDLQTEGEGGERWPH